MGASVCRQQSKCCFEYFPRRRLFDLVRKVNGCTYFLYCKAGFDSLRDVILDAWHTIASNGSTNRDQFALAFC